MPVGEFQKEFVALVFTAGSTTVSAIPQPPPANQRHQQQAKAIDNTVSNRATDHRQIRNQTGTAYP
jgi:hypothetical protein